MAIIEIAGLAVSAIGVFNDLLLTYRDLTKWDQADIEVDSDWLDLALTEGVLPGSADQYRWMNERRVPSAELRGTHNVIVAINKDKRLKYRVVRGKIHDANGRSILVRKVGS